LPLPRISGVINHPHTIVQPDWWKHAGIVELVRVLAHSRSVTHAGHALAWAVLITVPVQGIPT
jgi:hypothetical protein